MFSWLDSFIADSNREEDNNKYLHVENCVLTAEEVSEYLGKEIDRYGKMGLDPDTIYGVYRPLSEIEKALSTYNNLPLTDGHIQITPEKPARERILGTVGTNAHIQDGKLLNTVTVWTSKGKQDIFNADENKGGKKDLSCGYAYDIVPEEGVFNGKPYQFKMINLKGNHVALVPDGRVTGAMIADENIKKENTQVKKSLTQTILGFFVGDSKPAINLYDQAIAIDESDGDMTEKYKTLLELVRLESGKGLHDEDYQEKVIEKMNSKDKKAKDGMGMKILDAEKEEEKDCIPAKDKKAKDAESEKEEESEEMMKKKAKDKKAKDAESEKEEEKEEKAMDEAIQNGIIARTKIINLATKVMGKLSTGFMADASIEQIVDTALTKNKKVIANRSFETKLGMLEILADATIANRPQYNATDSKIKTQHVNIFDAMKGNK